MKNKTLIKTILLLLIPIFLLCICTIYLIININSVKPSNSAFLLIEIESSSFLPKKKIGMASIVEYKNNISLCTVFHIYNTTLKEMGEGKSLILTNVFNHKKAKINYVDFQRLNWQEEYFDRTKSQDTESSDQVRCTQIIDLIQDIGDPFKISKKSIEYFKVYSIYRKDGTSFDSELSALVKYTFFLDNSKVFVEGSDDYGVFEAIDTCANTPGDSGGIVLDKDSFEVIGFLSGSNGNINCGKQSTVVLVNDPINKN